MGKREKHTWRERKKYILGEELSLAWYSCFLWLSKKCFTWSIEHSYYHLFLSHPFPLKPSTFSKFYFCQYLPSSLNAFIISLWSTQCSCRFFFILASCFSESTFGWLITLRKISLRVWLTTNDLSPGYKIESMFQIATKILYASVCNNADIDNLNICLSRVSSDS